MPIQRSTGMPHLDAQAGFARARRQGQLARLAGWLHREPYDVGVILPFEEVVRELGFVSERELGRQVVALDTIAAGTVSAFEVEVSEIANTKSFQQNRNTRIAVVNTPGAASGAITLKKAWNGVAPST